MAELLSGTPCGQRSRPAKPPGESSILPLMREAVLLAAENLGADLGGASRFLPDGRSFEVVVASPPSRRPSYEPVKVRVPSVPMDSIVAYTVHTRQAVVAPDLGMEIRFGDTLLHDLGVRSALVVPTVLEGEPLGTLGIFCLRQKDYTPSDIQSLAASAAQLASLIGRLLRPGHSADATAAPDAPATSAPLAADQRRVCPRHEYDFCQLIAPKRGKRVPTRDQFFKVECRDISQSGISFFLKERPEFEELVALLGPAGAESRFIAHVVRTEPVDLDGRPMYLVGCRFAGRIG